MEKIALGKLSKEERRAFYQSKYEYYNTFNLTMHVYICELISGNPELLVHTESTWCSKDELIKLDFAEADYKFLNLI